jgi:hypothetical protein
MLALTLRCFCGVLRCCVSVLSMQIIGHVLFFAGVKISKADLYTFMLLLLIKKVGFN